MNEQKLDMFIDKYFKEYDEEKLKEELEERKKKKEKYQSYDYNKIINMIDSIKDKYLWRW